MEFKDFNKKIQSQFEQMCQSGKLFRSNISGAKVWETYLNSFKTENNKTFRDPESSEHNCNSCNNFIRRYGNIVAINAEGKLESIFSNIDNVDQYTDSTKACAELLENSEIESVFFETYAELNSLPYESCNKTQDKFQLGIAVNFKKYTQEEVNKFGVVNPEDVYEFNHFHLYLPNQFVDKSGNSIEKIMANYRDKHQVFKRAMEEIPLDTLNLVRDLIKQGSLLDGTAHLHAIELIIEEKNRYELCKNSETINNWFWAFTYNLDERVAKFKNTLIGVLCTELAEGMELNKACENWNKRVDPVNYHKATAPITQRQIKEAQKFVEENGYVESFDRRLATIDDIKVNEILHSNVGNGKIKTASIFDNVKPTSTQHKRSEFKGVEEVSIEKFMEDILPGCTSVEAYLENKMEGNLVTLTKASEDNSKSIFKWLNNYSWTFNGNLAGKSQIKENVKSVGGKIEGILRCSLQWNDKETPGIVDLDLHCRESKGEEIYYSNKKSSKTKGWLDVDMIDPTEIGIENITWQKSLPDMEYRFFVKNFNSQSNKGFKAEIEFNGNVFNYHYTNDFRGNVDIATITVKNGELSIKHHLPETNSSKELWGLETNKFHKVNLVCLSPNHWGRNQVGNLHFMFMLDGCKCDTLIRGFHNENLIPELLEHRKVMEVLGTTNMIEPTDKQLSGLGFNSTVKDELVLRLKGTHKRIIKIKF